MAEESVDIGETSFKRDGQASIAATVKATRLGEVDTSGQAYERKIQQADVADYIRDGQPLWPEGSEVSFLNVSSFHGRSLTEIVSSLHPHSRIWDLGCGEKTVALSELVDKFSDLQLQGTGVTLPMVKGDVNPPDNVTILKMDVDDFLRTFDKTQRPDVIYTNRMLEWINNRLLTVQLAYNALAQGGVLLTDIINNASKPIVDLHGNSVHPRVLEEYLREQGYDVEIHDIEEEGEGEDFIEEPCLGYRLAIQKTPDHPTLDLPIRLVTPEEVGATLTVDTEENERYYAGKGWEVGEDTQFVYQFVPGEDSPTNSI